MRIKKSCIVALLAACCGIASAQITDLETSIRDEKAVTEKNGNTYVSVVKENGEIVAQRFVAGGYNANNYWVVEGLTEGMEICLE